MAVAISSIERSACRGLRAQKPPRVLVPSTYAPVDKTLRRTAVGYAAGPPYDLVVGDIFNMHPYGNAAVVKPSELAPGPAARLFAVLATLPFPAGVASLVLGTGGAVGLGSSNFAHAIVPRHRALVSDTGIETRTF